MSCMVSGFGVLNRVTFMRSSKLAGFVRLSKQHHYQCLVGVNYIYFGTRYGVIIPRTWYSMQMVPLTRASICQSVVLRTTVIPCRLCNQHNMHHHSLVGDNCIYNRLFYNPLKSCVKSAVHNPRNNRRVNKQCPGLLNRMC